MLTSPRHARPRDPVPLWVGWVAVAVLCGVSLFVGFHDLSSRSLWLDESYTWVSVDQKWSTTEAIARGQGWHLLPYFLMLHWVIGVFGDSPTALRAPSVIAGAMSVPFMYLLATRLGGRLAALSACLLFVVSEPLVFWQQNARDYTFVVLFGLIGTWAGVVAVQTAKGWAYATWAVAMAIGCYTHPEMFFLVPVQVVVFLLWSPTNRTRVKFLILLGVGALGLTPALAYAKDSGVYKGTFLARPNHGSATEIASFLASAASSVGTVTPANHALLGITFFILIVAVAMLATDLTDNGVRAQNFGLALGLTWTVVPMLLDWLVSETGRQAFVDRYLIVSLPAVALVIAQVVQRIKPRAVGLFAVGYLAIFHTGLLVENYKAQLDDYRDATQFILDSARPGTCVAFDADAGRIAYDYYQARITAHRRYYTPLPVFPTATDASAAGALHYGAIPAAVQLGYQQPSSIAAVLPACGHIFVLESHFGNPSAAPAVTDPYYLLFNLTTNLRLHYKSISAKEFPGGIFVEDYQRVGP